MATTRAVLLDAGGTLFHRVPGTGEVIRGVLTRHGIDATHERVERAFHVILHKEGVPGPEGPEEAWLRLCERILEEAGAPPTRALARELAAALDGPRAAYPDAVPALRALRARGQRLLVVSNFTHALPRILDELALTPHFDSVLYSWKFGAAKPDPRIYRAALEAAGVAPEEALMVGDSPEHDVEGPRALGIPALHLDRRGPARTGSIRSLAEIERHLRR